MAAKAAIGLKGLMAIDKVSRILIIKFLFKIIISKVF